MNAVVSQPADLVQPFQIDRGRLRGRLVRLGPALDDILSRHAYPPVVARLLAEALTVTVTLATALKYDGIFTLQTKGDGPVSLMVADVTSTGDLRGYAQFNPARLDALGPDIDGPAPVSALLGTGHLAFSVDQGDHTDRYQGIVERIGDTLSECVQHYFRQSEQLGTALKLAAATGPDGRWHAAALMLQRLPENTQTDTGSAVEDDWRRAMVLMSTAQPAELIGPDLDGHTLLFRLFHEDGVRVFPTQTIRFACRCDRDRVANVLRSLPRTEISELKVNGAVEVTCEFCSTVHRFDEDDLDAVYR
jgi:molecular chaperone Hsp33